MSNAKEFKAGDRAFAKVGRNVVEVRVKAKTDAGWTVVSRSGKTISVKSLEASPDAAPAARPKKTPPAPSERAVPKKGLSLLSAAAAVLERSNIPMTVGEMIEKAKESGLWTPGAGKTPAQTLYSAIVREIKEKDRASRFRKDSRGRFSFVG